ncbi:hypothetical protein FRC02_001208 [Tulasnella sp. 418]|nr:hypothetical protein FRC02_001208 [Tulasnella sp. 418]
MGFMVASAVLEILTHIALFLYRMINVSPKDAAVWMFYTPLLPVIVHLYIATRTLLHPPQKAPLEVFILIVFLWSGRIMDLSYAMYGGLISGVKEDRMVMLTKVVDLVALNVMLTSVLVMPLGIPPQVLVMPQEGDDEEGSPPPAPEDYTTLWGWISFSWVSPLIDQGTIQDLTEHDIPDLSPSLQSKPVYRRFADFNQSTLLRRIIAANSLDFFLDCSLTLVSSAVPYALLYFLKNILYHVEHLDTIPHAKLTICIYAILAFLTTLARAELDLQHLWFGRRFCTRARSELMALIYEKALKRKYFSVIVKKGATSGDSNDGTDEADCKMREKLEEEDTKNRQNAAANIGKIVELMSSGE